MTRTSFHLRLGFLTAALVFCCLQLVSAQNFQVTSDSINAQGKFTVGFASDINSYFILNRGPQVLTITSPVAMVLGQAGGGQLTDTVAAVGASFFTVQKVPLTQPHDSDGDGIDDVFELQHSSFLNPLNSGDANLDFDGDGVSNLREYQRGTNPASAASVNTTLYANSVIGSDTLDGITPTMTSWVMGTHGPKLTIQGAVSVGVSGDNVSIAAGNYQQTLLDAGSKSITLLPQGNVTIQ
jgi:hypothetical protein